MLGEPGGKGGGVDLQLYMYSTLDTRCLIKKLINSMIKIFLSLYLSPFSFSLMIVVLYSGISVALIETFFTYMYSCACTCVSIKPPIHCKWVSFGPEKMYI